MKSSSLSYWIKASFVIILALVLATCEARPPRRPTNPVVMQTPSPDQLPAASHHAHHGRVQIKVYRGPDHHEHGHHFAPHGYWVKQPADDPPHH